jgi:serine protease Do
MSLPNQPAENAGETRIDPTYPTWTAPAPAFEAPPITPFEPAASAGPAPAPRRKTARLSPLALAAIIAIAGGVTGSAGTYVVTTALTAPASSAVASQNGSSVVLTSTSSSGLPAVIANATKSVVTITVQTTAATRFGQTAATGIGSGIIVSSNGTILTNAHVVSGATSVQVTLPDGQTVSGTVYGTSSTTDLAIVKVNATGLTAATIGNSSSLAVGQTVVAIGDPLGEFNNSASAGIVSGLNRSVAVENENLTGMIQIDAAVNPGNSGGPLIDTAGNVVGVVTAGSTSAEGINFAIPISAATSIIQAANSGQPVA